MPRKKSSGPSIGQLKTRVGIFLWPKSLWRKSLTVLTAIVLLLTLIGFSVGQWYENKHKNEPLVLGSTFISDYAAQLELEPQATLEAMLGDLGIKRIRLVSYWKKIEATPGTYDFSELDWQFAMAEKYGADVSLAIGMRQPRWPECHEPKWAMELPKAAWEPKLMEFMTAVISRYKDHPALVQYQLENEFFMEVFGECKDFDRNRLIKEFELVKSLDNNTPVSISRSNNWIGLPLGQPRPDVFGISIYKRVWDKTLTKRYFEYPLPAWFYGMLAGGAELLTGRNMFIHELQAEPWTPNDLFITQASVEEQFKSMNAERMRARLEYAKSTGMRTIDLWGAEWWYWLKIKRGDPSVWLVVKDALMKAEVENSKLKK